MDLNFEEFSFRVADGTKLSGRDYGRRVSDRRPVVCLAGLTRNVRDFDALAQALSCRARPRRVIALDYRGRGKSDHAPAKTYTVPVEASDVLAGITARGISEAHFVGTSRGGLLCMAIGALRPGLLKTVVLNDIGPVIHVAYLAGIKAHVAGQATPSSWEAAARALQTAYEGAFTRMSSEDWSRLARQFYADENGRPTLAFDTALAEGLDSITETTPPASIWPQFGTLSSIPVLALRGENSPLLDQKTFHAMGRSHTGLEMYLVPHEGHAPLLWDKPSQSRIARFFDSHEE